MRSSAAERSSAAGTAGAARPANQPTGRPAGFGIYIHWPFCRAKCPYCDFNSHVRDRVDQARWRRALRRDLDRFRERLAAAGPLPTVTSLFFGGGTPSLMPPDTVAALVDDVRHRWPTGGAVEITLEANPTSVEADRLSQLVAAGVNRLSIGVQALNDRDLHFLGRQHSAGEARRALEIAGATGAARSFDLIYARPGQTAAAWEAELATAIRMAVGADAPPRGGHLSLYQLTIEPGTGFHAAVARGDWTPLADDPAADLFLMTQQQTAAAGLPAYEISSHAAPGEACRHNLTYWRGGDYVGVGPGAHGRLTLMPATAATDMAVPHPHAVEQIRTPEAWLAAVEAHGHGTRRCDPIAPGDRAVEAVLMGMRLHEGVDLRRLSALAGGVDPLSVLDRGGLARMLDGGFVVLDPAPDHMLPPADPPADPMSAAPMSAAMALRATEAGRRVLDAVIAELISPA